MTLKYKFSGDLLQARKGRGWTQPEAAEELGISLREYQNIEGGKCIPQTELFLRVVVYFNLAIEQYMEIAAEIAPAGRR